MARPTVITFPTTDPVAICATQSLAAAGNLTLNGTLLDLTTPPWPKVPLGHIDRTVTLTSTANNSGTTFVISGTNTRGAAVTSSAITGPNNSTVLSSTTALFMTVTNIAASAAATSIAAGTGTSGFTNWVKINRNIAPVGIGIQVVMSATTDNYTVQYTQDPLTTSPAIFAHPTLTALASSADGNIAFACHAIRLAINSATGGSATLTITQGGISN